MYSVVYSAFYASWNRVPGRTRTTTLQINDPFWSKHLPLILRKCHHDLYKHQLETTSWRKEKLVERQIETLEMFTVAESQQEPTHENICEFSSLCFHSYHTSPVLQYLQPDSHYASSVCLCLQIQHKKTFEMFFTPRRPLTDPQLLKQPSLD